MFTIGIVGHRPNRLAASALPHVQAEFVALLGLASAELGKVPCAIRVLTSLAEGADRIGAEIGLAAGMPLQVVLPLAEADYEMDFANEASRSEFRRLLSQAESVAALMPKTADDDARDRAYHMASQVLLSHADLLFAVWDGKPAAGRGGTAMTIDEACSRGIPVVVIDALGVQPSRLIWHGLRQGALRSSDPNMLPSTKAGEVLPDVLQRLTAPPGGSEGDQLRKFQESVRAIGTEADTLEQAHRQADQLADRHAGQFRRAVVLNFICAFFAIVFAVGGFLALLNDGLYTIKPALLLGELALLGLIVLNTSIGRQRQWQEWWIGYRELAEHLRVAKVLRHVGARAFDTKGEEPHWVQWQVRQHLRRAGLPRLRLDASGLESAKKELVAFAQGQRDYHERAASGAHRREHLLELAGSAAFILALALASFALLAPLFGYEHPGAWKQAISASAIILPAFGSALLGIRLIADFASVAARSHEAAEVFTDILRHLEEDPPDLRHLRVRAAEIADISLRDVLAWRTLAENRKLDWPG